MVGKAIASEHVGKHVCVCEHACVPVNTCMLGGVRHTQFGGQQGLGSQPALHVNSSSTARDLCGLGQVV